MKKCITQRVLAAFLACLLVGHTFNVKAETQDKKISIVSTIFPVYDWVVNVLGESKDQVELTLLLDSGIDLHNYQPTADDMVKIATCDVFIYVGGESDGWVEDVLKVEANPNRRVINLLHELGEGTKAQIPVEGMQEDHDHEEPILQSDITDRSLNDFTGSFTSMNVYLEDGLLDAYVAHEAEESGVTFDEKMAQIKALNETDYPVIHISGDTLTVQSPFEKKNADYSYAGYRTVKDEEEHIVAVWYVYETPQASNDLPRYIAFHDHAVKHEETDHEVKNFHMRYTNQSIDALMDGSTQTPTYYQSSADAQEVMEALEAHSHEEEIDEHVWLSLKNAQALTSRIAEQLAQEYPSTADIYNANAAKYIKQLSQMDEAYQEVVSQAAYQTLLFGDRFPFRYLADDYGLDYYAAFSGCSAETEASFETIAFLSGKANELNLKNIITIEGSTHQIAQTIAQNVKRDNLRVLTLDSMQSVTLGDIESGTTYLNIMQSNLQVIKDALN